MITMFGRRTGGTAGVQAALGRVLPDSVPLSLGIVGSIGPMPSLSSAGPVTAARLFGRLAVRGVACRRVGDAGVAQARSP
jgi:hypothetical protein